MTQQLPKYELWALLETIPYALGDPNSKHKERLFKLISQIYRSHCYKSPIEEMMDELPDESRIIFRKFTNGDYWARVSFLKSDEHTENDGNTPAEALQNALNDIESK